MKEVGVNSKVMNSMMERRIVHYLVNIMISSGL